MTDGPESVRAKTGALLDFLEDYYRLSSPPIRDIRDYKDFVLRQAELPMVPGVELTPAAEVWLTSTLVPHPEPPEIPSELESWLSERTVSPKQPPALAEPEEGGAPPPTEVYESWVAEAWEPWSERWQLVERSREFYKNLYGLRARVERDRDGVELVWGFGRLRWDTPQGTLDHPMITVPVELTLDREGRIEIEPSGSTQIESAYLGEVDLVGRSDYLALRQSNRADDIELWDEASRSELLHQLLRFVDHDGQFGSAAPPPTRHATVSDEWVLFVRRRQADYVAFLEAQRQLYQEGVEPALPFLSLVVDQPSLLAGEVVAPGAASEAPSQGQALDNTLYLPKPANEEQYRILHLAQTRPGVTAQGPPGTGKSHTIANLICHFVALGQRVLVTAEKEQALAVLTEKLPPAVRELTVSILGSDQASRTRLEEAINTIQERVSTHDPNYLTGEIARLTQTIADIDAEQAFASNQLRAARAAEATPLPEVWAVTPSKAASWLKDNEADLGFVDDPISASTPLPLAGSDWEELVSLVGSLDPTDLMACALDRPDPAVLPPGADLARRNDELAHLRARLAGAEGIVTDWGLVDQAGPAMLAELTRAVHEAADWRRKIAGTWLDRVRVEAAGPLTRQEWTDFAQGVAAAREQALAYRRAVVAYEVLVPTPATDEIRAGLNEAAARFAAGKGVGLRQRSAAKALATCRVDGRKPTTAEQATLCLYALARDEHRQRLRIAWANGIGRVGGPALDDRLLPEDAVGDHLGELDVAIAWTTSTWPRLVAGLNALGVRCPPDPTVEDLDQLGAAIEATSARARERALTDELHAVDRYLKAGMRDDASPLWGEFAQAGARCAWNRWDELLAEAGRLGGLAGRVERHGILYSRLAAIAPRFAARLTASRALDAPDHKLLGMAWQWRRLDGLVSAMTASPSAGQLQRRLEDLARRRLVVMEQLVAAKAWDGLAKGFDDKKRGALNKYLIAIKKFGKTGGKYKLRWLRLIREALDESKDAVPVWVMPTTRVLNSFRPAATPPFDVLIIDEASQIGLLALPILSLARKAIIVGDDQQTSPENVGLNRQPVFDLIDDHLYDVHNSKTLFDPDNSLYDVARQQFPEVVVLKEHFRCLPQIISFSNSRYYHGQMIPLRDKAPTHNWQPVGTVFVPHGVRGGSDTNHAEAKAIVDLVAEMCADPDYEGMTFGVVTLLSGGQAKLIQDMLLDRLGPEVLEARGVRCGDPAMFQGDERHVIILSTVVDRSDGRRIGAMTDRKAERRLNVAASRAQNQMWVVHSVEAVDFPAGDPRAELIRHCENPGSAETAYADIEQRCESQFERDVLRRILDKGYRRVRAQWEVGRYRIDIVVEGADRRLAIECDGDTWHGPDRWDEDRSRQQKLERAGWTFERIRGSAFYRDPDRSLEPLWAHLNELQISPGVWDDRPSSRGPNRRVISPPSPTTNVETGAVSFTVGPTPIEAGHLLGTQPVSRARNVKSGPILGGAIEEGPPSEPPRVAPKSPSTRTDAGLLRDQDDAIDPSGHSFAAIAPQSLSPDGCSQSGAIGDAPADEDRFAEAGQLLAPYRFWEPREVGLVLNTDPKRILVELGEILMAEGPMLALRLYQTHSRAAGNQRVGPEMRSTYNRIVSSAVRAGSIAQLNDAIPGVIEKTLFAPGTQPVKVRTLGTRQLHEIPRSELATLIRRLGLDGAETELLKREVLASLGLVRLTKNTSDYIDSCLTYTWS
jgi:very-short-patch-repair endonuclease